MGLRGSGSEIMTRGSIGISARTLLLTGQDWLSIRRRVYGKRFLEIFETKIVMYDLRFSVLMV